MSSAITTIRAVPALVTIEGKAYNITGRCHVPMVVQHLKDHLAELSPRKKWCVVECLTKAMFLNKSKENQAKVRKAIAPTFRKCLKLGMFLAIEYNGKCGKITAVKIYEIGGGSDEQQAAEKQLDRMRARGEVSVAAWNHGRQLVSLLPAAPDSTEL